jgi:hypothetical protein
MYGDNDHRYEPSTSEPRASVFLLQPDKTYFWKSTWDSEFRTTVSEVGLRSDAVLQPRQNSRRALQAEPAVCLSRRTQRTERYRVGLGPRRDLSQRLARTPAAASIARQRAAATVRFRRYAQPGLPESLTCLGLPGCSANSARPCYLVTRAIRQPVRAQRRAPAFRWSPSRKASAPSVSVGLALDADGKTDVERM